MMGHSMISLCFKPNLHAARYAVYGWRRARPVVDGTTQADLLFETSSSFSRCQVARHDRIWAVQDRTAEKRCCYTR